MSRKVLSESFVKLTQFNERGPNWKRHENSEKLSSQSSPESFRNVSFSEKFSLK